MWVSDRAYLSLQVPRSDLPLILESPIFAQRLYVYTCITVRGTRRRNIMLRVSKHKNILFKKMYFWDSTAEHRNFLSSKRRGRSGLRTCRDKQVQSETHLQGKKGPEIHLQGKVGARSSKNIFFIFQGVRLLNKSKFTTIFGFEFIFLYIVFNQCSPLKALVYMLKTNNEKKGNCRKKRELSPTQLFILYCSKSAFIKTNKMCTTSFLFFKDCEES